MDGYKLFEKKYILLILMFCGICRILGNIPVSMMCTAVLAAIAAYVDKLIGID